MRKFLAVLSFFVCFIFIYGIGCNIFPVDEVENVAYMPDWYGFVLIPVPLFIARAIWKCGAKKWQDFSPVKSNKGTNEIKSKESSPLSALNGLIPDNFEPDTLFITAANIVMETRQASVSMLQRRLDLGYSRAVHLVNQLEECKIVGHFQESAPREILVSKEDWNRIKPDIQKLVDERIERLISARALNPSANSVDFDLILKEEENWRRLQAGLSLIEYELKKIDAMSGRDFEYWCAELLKKTGFENVEVTQGSGDQGVDVLAEKSGIKYAIQCKCYSSDLGNAPVQEVNAGKAIYHCHIGAVMTNRHFTAGARQAAEANNILLWDRDSIIKMLKEANA